MTAIELHGQTATGGRNGGVGVGGLTLGGGLSFHTSRRGVAADDVINFEIVVANGSVVNANAKQNTDLFKALKGGGNNFGVITRIDMRTFNAAPQGIYGGLLFTDYSQKDRVLDQFIRLIDINADNKADTEVVTVVYNSPGPASIAMVVVNTDGVANSTSFQPLNGMPTIIKDVKLRTYGELIIQYSETPADRYGFLNPFVLKIVHSRLPSAISVDCVVRVCSRKTNSFPPLYETTLTSGIIGPSGSRSVSRTSGRSTTRRCRSMRRL